MRWALAEPVAGAGQVAAVRVDVPVGVSVFPHEIFKASKRWCEARYKQLAYHNVLDKGGHFAAFEQPELFVGELRECFRAFR